MAQDVFIQVCSEGFLEKADRQKGKFRALLLAVTRHIISSHRRHRGAARRDRRREVPIEDFEFPDKAPVDDDFDAAWAQNLLRVATERLGDDPGLDVLMTHLRGTTCRELAERLGKTEHAVEGLVYRVKERLRREVERVVSDYAQDGERDEELAGMLRLLMRERGPSR